MTSKDYRLLAMGLGTLADESIRRQATEAIADVCEKDNPRFSRYRFLCAVQAATAEQIEGRKR